MKLKMLMKSKIVALSSIATKSSSFIIRDILIVLNDRISTKLTELKYQLGFRLGISEIGEDSFLRRRYAGIWI